MYPIIQKWPFRGTGQNIKCLSCKTWPFTFLKNNLPTLNLLIKLLYGHTLLEQENKFAMGYIFSNLDNFKKLVNVLITLLLLK